MARKQDREAVPQMVVAHTSGTIRIDGARRFYQRGRTVLPINDALVQAIPHKFRPFGRPAEKPGRAVVAESVALPVHIPELAVAPEFTPKAESLSFMIRPESEPEPEPED